MTVNMVMLLEPQSGAKRPKLTTPQNGAFAILLCLSGEICTECFERLVSNILQGDKMPHFLYFV
jgi:hypothetical protein